MIEWISDWLKQIIILVLIATFIDLLLPNNALDRYVKLVMGLLIIMAILTPIFQLLTQDLDLSALAFANVPAEQKQMASLHQIQEQSNQMKETQDRLIQEQTTKQMELNITEQVEQKFGVEVMEAKVALQTGPEGMAQIKHIHVMARVPISPHSAAEGKPIQPVHIAVGEGETVPASGRVEQAGQTFISKISTYLSDVWHLRREQVHVVVDAL
jgi:stage III sporulation protein AF